MNSAILYSLEEKPPLLTTFFVALQHLLAVFGGIVTAPLLISLGMGLNVEQTSYMVSSSLLISGLATFIQINRIGPIGSGLLSIQGTSFTFIGPLVSAYVLLQANESTEQALGIIFGTSAVCAVIVGCLGQCLEGIKKIVTPNVTGTTVMLIGVSLIWATLTNIHREYSATENTDQAFWVLGLSLSVFILTLMLSRSKRPFIRILSVTIGLLLGSAAAYFVGLVDLSQLAKLDGVFIPQFSRFPLAFDLSVMVILLPIFIISSVESIGDLTATSSLSNISLSSIDYWQRLRGGISGDAFNSFIASLFCSFPNTTFSQNNGVIRLTGVCSRYVGRYTALMLCLLGLFPIVGGLFVLIPGAVLYGATMLMFAMVFLSGIAIVMSNKEDKYSWWICATAIIGGTCLAALLPRLDGVPQWIVATFSFPVSTGAVLAIVLEGARNLRTRAMAVADPL